MTPSEITAGRAITNDQWQMTNAQRPLNPDTCVSQSWYSCLLGCTTNFIELCACVRRDFLHRGFSPVNKNGKKLKGFSR
jgi:hypothetical protein